MEREPERGRRKKWQQSHAFWGEFGWLSDTRAGGRIIRRGDKIGPGVVNSELSDERVDRGV